VNEEPPPVEAAAGAVPRGTSLGVWRLAWPTMVSFALQSLVGLVDFLFVASLGTEAVAAVGIAHQFYFAQFSVLAAVTTGSVALVARFTGAGEAAEADRVLRMSALLAAGLGVALMAVIPLADEVVAAFGVHEPVIGLGASYLRILLAFNLPFALGVAVGMGVRGAGDARTPLLVGVVVNAVNVVLNYGLVYGRLGLPRLGTDGSALGTGIAVSCGAAVWLALWSYDQLAVPRLGWRAGLAPALARRILRIGVPTFVEQAIWQLGLMVFLRIVARYGTEPVSAYLIGVRILSFSFVPGLGFSTAGGTLVGQHLGARDPALAARAGWRANAGAMAVMGCVGLAIILLARPMAGWFGATGPSTVDLTVTFIYILGAAQPLMAVEFALGGSLRGAGDTRFPLVAILTGLFAARLAGAILVAEVFGGSVVAVWSCLLADYAVKAGLLSLRFASGAWQRVRV
jgi:putative MATE family efflux protein